MKIYHIKKLYLTKCEPHHYSEKGNAQVLVFTKYLFSPVKSILTKFDDNMVTLFNNITKHLFTDND